MNDQDGAGTYWSGAALNIPSHPGCFPEGRLARRHRRLLEAADRVKAIVEKRERPFGMVDFSQVVVPRLDGINSFVPSAAGLFPQAIAAAASPPGESVVHLPRRMPPIGGSVA